jgi:ribosomal protein L29
VKKEIARIRTVMRERESAAGAALGEGSA